MKHNEDWVNKMELEHFFNEPDESYDEDFEIKLLESKIGNKDIVRRIKMDCKYIALKSLDSIDFKSTYNIALHTYKYCSKNEMFDYLNGLLKIFQGVEKLK